jgi:uncharacterized protein YjbI with pentapeptide repeats
MEERIQTPRTGARPEGEAPSVPRTPAPGELDGLVAAHLAWLAEDRRRGALRRPRGAKARAWLQDSRRADLRGFKLDDLAARTLRHATLDGAHLQGCDLSRADLRHASLRAADLTGARLEEARLGGADLSRAQLAGADLSGADLRDTDLQDADLTGVKGLRARQIGGADLSGARLPASAGGTEALETVRQSARIDRRILIIVLAACALALVTLSATTDARLVANASVATLPLLDAGVPSFAFYTAAPLLLLALYLYFHLALHRLWAGLADLPAFFPDGRPVDRRADPWLLTSLARAHFPRLGSERPLVEHAQRWISVLLAWGVVPLTMVALWARYLRRHDPIGTAEQILAILLAIAAGTYLYSRAVSTLRGEPQRTFIWKGWTGALLSNKAATAAVVAAALLLEYASLGAIQGRYWNAQLWGADISVKPGVWTGADAQVGLVKGASLRGRNLRRADARRAFLARADLEGACLEGALLDGADLREANLRGAHLEGARLEGANLRRSDLRDATLQNARLTQSDLQGARLVGAKLTGADLYRSDLRGVSLRETRMPRAKMVSADLRGADLKGARMLGSQLAKANLAGADLRGAKLKLVNFQGTDLRGADLRGADLYRTKLFGANLGGADLREVTHLRQWQIDQACLDGKTRLPAKIERPASRPERCGRWGAG